MSKKEKYFVGIALILVLGWWFRYDTNCSGQDNYIACTAYDRFTGDFVFPVREAHKHYRNTESNSTNE